MVDKPILALDFDGVIHRYDSPWAGPAVIADDIVPGFWDWAERAAQHFKLVIYSSRSHQEGGQDAMVTWLAAKRIAWRRAGGRSLGEPFEIECVDHKPPGLFLTIDDCCVRFEGEWPDPEELLRFRPWNKRTEALSPAWPSPRPICTQPPEMCDWPICGCDPKALEVIEALDEDGALKVNHPVRDMLRRRQST